LSSISRTDDLSAADSLNHSVFESLREIVYSEVASLISQNETRPHYLIELFQRLQLLNTDNQRRRLMATIDQLVTDYHSDADDLPSDSMPHHHSVLQRSVSY